MLGAVPRASHRGAVESSVTLGTVAGEVDTLTLSRAVIRASFFRAVLSGETNAAFAFALVAHPVVGAIVGA